MLSINHQTLVQNRFLLMLAILFTQVHKEQAPVETNMLARAKNRQSKLIYTSGVFTQTTRKIEKNLLPYHYSLELLSPSTKELLANQELHSFIEGVLVIK